MNDNLKTILLQRLTQLENDIVEIKMLLDNDLDNASSSIEQTDINQNNSPEHSVTTLFSLVQQDISEEGLSKALSSILHSSISQHSIALDNFIRYSFKTFQGRWKEYLQDQNDPSSFQVIRSQENNRGELSEIRLYLHVSHRSATPITLKKDPEQGLCWKIFSLSL